MARSLLCGVVLSAAVAVRALVHSEPRATDTIAIHQDAWSPAPTAPPALHEYFKRQNGKGQTVLVAPDNTCGYVSAQSGAAYTCAEKTALCVFITASGTGAAGCCGSVDCGFRVACLDYDQMYSSSVCDAQCSTDTLTEKCTGTAFRFCNTIAFANGATDYFCNSVRVSTAQSADTTFSGQTGRTLAQTVLTDEVAPTRRETTTVTAIFSPTGSNTSGSSSSSTPVGAIVGGVVGGVAVLGLIGLGIFFLMRQKKKTKFEPVPLHPPGSETTQNNLSPGPPGAGKPGHQSVMSNYSNPPTYGSPTPPLGASYQQFSPPPGSGGSGSYYPPGAYGSQAVSPPHHQQSFPQPGYGQPSMPVEMEAPRRAPRHELQ